MHSIIVSLFALLLICVFAWLSIYRNMGRADIASHPHYRLHQLLLGLIATLVIVLALLVVFSSDPGPGDDYLWWP